MRVASNSHSESLTQQLNALAQRQSQLYLQASSGQRLTTASDDPTAARRSLDRTAEMCQWEQYQRNIENQEAVATETAGSLKSLKTISQRASEIATSATGLSSPTQLTALAKEVDALLEQALSLGNTKYTGAYLFGGTAATQAPFEATRNAEDAITGVTYVGNSATAAVEVTPGTTLSVQIPGVNTTGTGERGLFADSGADTDLFQHLIQLRQHLEDGDTKAVQATDLPALLRDEDSIVLHVADNATTLGRLETSATQVEDRLLASQEAISGDIDADLTTVLTQLSASQVSYQAALSCTAKLLNTSLLNYLS